MHSVDLKNLKLCQQDLVIRVVSFHGLGFFFFYKGETQSRRLSQIFISEEVVKLYMKKKRKRKAAVSLHGHVLLTKWKYHREDGLNSGELRPREKWNHECKWTHMHTHTKKTYTDNLALLWEQKTCHLKVPGIVAKEEDLLQDKWL